MLEVKFYRLDEISDHMLQYAVIAARHCGKWIFCRHKARATWEMPGGHREKEEPIDRTASRELYEETGATRAEICPIAVYGVDDGTTETYGMLFMARIDELQPLDERFEIAEIKYFDAMPCELTYPQIQPHLFDYILTNCEQSGGQIADSSRGIESQTRIQRIRESEKRSHLQMYAEHELFDSGSWLAHPVKTVMELLPHFETYRSVRVLDLGCGVGRNSIPIAKAFSHIPCVVDCVDILPYAIEKLHHNATVHGVEHMIHGIAGSIEDFPIAPHTYDFAIAVSALEHICSYDAFCRKLQELRQGMRAGGIICLIVSTDITETALDTGESLPVQFELNFSASELKEILQAYFSAYMFLTEKCVPQQYVIPRDDRQVRLSSCVCTYILKNERKTI